MADLYLDLRDQRTRRRPTASATEALKWFADSRTNTIDWGHGALVVARSDDSELWSPATLQNGSQRIIAALAGRVAFESTEWLNGRDSLGEGGLACRIAIELYRTEGLRGLERLNGNFALVLIDEAQDACHLVTDRCGAILCYKGTAPVVCTHPDVLAAALDESEALDWTSLGEFVETGRTTFPHTYYQNIRALSCGTIHSFQRSGGAWEAQPGRRYFDFTPKFENGRADKSLADDFADAFRAAVRRRSLNIYGRTAVGLSGGLDSRAIVASASAESAGLEAFTLIDEPNAELRASRAIAAAGDVPLRVVRREFDHYGLSAADGARIGGGTGCLASNHFLQARPWFHEHGFENLLTGCYCDYLFKGLALNTRESPVLREQRLQPSQPQFYRPTYFGATSRADEVQARMQEWIPERIADDTGDAGLFELERRRTFPFANEADSAQRTITQRVLPWFLPVADNDLLEIYQRIPSRLKLNGRIFRAMLRRVCSPQLLRVPTSNTGASVLAGPTARAFFRYRSALANRFRTRGARKLATRGSWPNWEHYVRSSELFKSQWRQRTEASDVLRRLLPPAFLQRPAAAFPAGQIELLQRVWTLKLWLEHRVGGAQTSLLPVRGATLRPHDRVVVETC